MSEIQADGLKNARDRENRAAKEPVELTAQVFAELIGNASRLLTGVAALDAFKEAKLGLAEWTALTLIARGEGMTSRQIAAKLGVSAQRVNQLTESLKAAGLISITTSSEDSRKKAIRITQAGQNELDSLNAKLSPVLVEPMKARARGVVRIARGLKRLTKVVSPRKARGERGERARARRAAKA